MKLVNDTLKNSKGKWSRKSLTAFTAFAFALAYESILPFFEISTKEYVFITLLALVAASLGLSVLDKSIHTNNTNNEED